MACFFHFSSSANTGSMLAVEYDDKVLHNKKK